MPRKRRPRLTRRKFHNQHLRPISRQKTFSEGSSNAGSEIPINPETTECRASDHLQIPQNKTDNFDLQIAVSCQQIQAAKIIIPCDARFKQEPSLNESRSNMPILNEAGTLQKLQLQGHSQVEQQLLQQKSNSSPSELPNKLQPKSKVKQASPDEVVICSPRKPASPAAKSKPQIILIDLNEKDEMCNMKNQGAAETIQRQDGKRERAAKRQALEKLRQQESDDEEEEMYVVKKTPHHQRYGHCQQLWYEPECCIQELEQPPISNETDDDPLAQEWNVVERPEVELVFCPSKQEPMQQVAYNFNQKQEIWSLTNLKSNICHKTVTSLPNCIDKKQLHIHYFNESLPHSQIAAVQSCDRLKNMTVLDNS